MARRSTRSFSDMDRQALLAAAGQCRNACTTASSKAPIGGAEYVAVGKLMDAIDGLAETLTGDRTHFHLKPHSTHGGPR